MYENESSHFEYVSGCELAREITVMEVYHVSLDKYILYIYNFNRGVDCRFWEGAPFAGRVGGLYRMVLAQVPSTTKDLVTLGMMMYKLKSLSDGHLASSCRSHSRPC